VRDGLSCLVVAKRGKYWRSEGCGLKEVGRRKRKVLSFQRCYGKSEDFQIVQLRVRQSQFVVQICFGYLDVGAS
jgi:hypothetical protein